MLATPTEEPFSGENWLFERKLDGVRAICSRDGAEEHPELWSRNQNSISASYPEIVETLAERGGPRFVADGELVAFDGAQTSFAALQQRIHLTGRSRIEATGVRVFYYLFDLLFYDGHEATTLPVRQRKRLLSRAFEFADPLRLSPHRNTDGEHYFAQACARGWEGLIAKRSDSPYRSGRSGDWLKLKCVREQEFVVGGFTDPTGSRAGFGALMLGYYERTRLRYAGKVGTGYDDATLRSLRRRLDGMEQADSPFGERVHEPGRHWVRPELVVQVRYSEWTEDGKLRHPRYTGLRTDKYAGDVTGQG